MSEGRQYSASYFSRPGVKFTTDIRDPTERVQRYLNDYDGEAKFVGFDEALMRDHLKLISASATPTATVIFELEVLPVFVNRLDNMHGGAVALVHDMCTTMCVAPISREDFWAFGGVSRTLNITYLRPVPVGTRLIIECEVLQIGSRLATIRGVMKDKASGKILSVAEHNKASVVFQQEVKL